MADNERPEPTEPRHSGWSIVLLLAVVLGAIVFSQTILRRERPDPGPRGEGRAGSVVVLVIDAGDGLPKEGAVAWSEGMTVLEALESAPLGWPGAVDRSGDGANAFVNSIGGFSNEGAAGRNWQYFVNDQRGQVGAGVRTVTKGDRVLWKFAGEE